MPAARSPADILVLAVYTLAGGRILRGFMVDTVAQRLGIDYDRAEAMADAADKAGWVKHHPPGVVTLTAEGQARGARLEPPKN